MSLPAQLWQVACRVLGELRNDPGKLRTYSARALKLLRQHGVRGGLAQATQQSALYADWVARYDTLTSNDIALIEAHAAKFTAQPLISLLVPLYNTPEPFLRKCIESVRVQLYPHWELCLVDDASSHQHVREVCEEYARLDPRIRFVRRQLNGHISAATNTALEMAEGTYCALLDHDDELAPHALYMIAAELNEHPATDMIFSDEDKIDEQGTRYEPWFKSDWNYDLMLSQNAVVHLAVYRTSILREIGGFRSSFDGSQDYDVTLRVSERSTPERIRHIPFILYHWRAIQGSVALGETEKLYPYEAGQRAIQEHLHRTGRNATVVRQAHLGYYRVTWPVPEPAPRVSIVVSVNRRPDRLHASLISILEKTGYTSYELIVAGTQDQKRRTPDLFRGIAQLPNVRVLIHDHPCSLAALNNWAVAQTNGPVLAFLNSGVEAVEPGWLQEMVGHALRPEVGMVGAKLLSPDGKTHHAGIVMGISGLAGLSHFGEPADSSGYFGRAACTQRYFAITSACMAMRRDVFEYLGGFEEKHFPMVLSDLDLGIRAHEAGLANVWTPHAKLLCHDSICLAHPDEVDRDHQFLQERSNFRDIWADTIANDPHYNLNQNRSKADFSPAFPPGVKRPWVPKDSASQ